MKRRIVRIIRFIRRQRRAAAALALFAVSMLIFAFFMGNTVSAAPGKARVEYLFNPGEPYETEISRDGLRQTITYEGELYAVIFFINAERPLGVIQCRVFDAGNTAVTAVSRDLSEIEPGGAAAFVFDEPINSASALTFELTADSPAPVLIKAGPGAPGGWKLQNGSEDAGTAVMLAAETERLGNFILVFYWVFAVFLSAAVSAVYIIASKKETPLHRIYAVCAALLGLMYCFLLPPYSAPDEQFHINETFTVSSRWLGEMPEERVSDAVNVKRSGDENAVIQDLNTTAFSYKALIGNIFSPAGSSEPAVYDGEQVGGYEVLFWPAAIGVTAGRILHLGFVPTLLLGRFANLACYIVLTALSVKYAPIKKGVFALVGILPVTAHLAASFNRDAPTVGLYMLFTAYCLYLILKKPRVTLKNLLILAGISLLALPAKVVYAPSLLLTLFIPNDKIRIGKKDIAPSAVKFAEWGIVAAGAAVFILTALPYIRISLRQPVDISQAEHIDDIRYTTPYVLSHLRDTVWLTLNTVFSNAAFYLETLVGGKLGYFNIDISLFFVLAFYLLLFAAVIPENNGPRPGKKLSAAGAALAVVSSLLVVYACINWTPTYYLTIYGIQGRYFIPLLPLLLCCAANKRRPALIKAADTDRKVIFAGFTLSAFTLLNAFLVILER